MTHGNTFVKAATQGGADSGGGGGLPGTWTLVASGLETVQQNTTHDVASLPLPSNLPGVLEAYFFVCSPGSKNPAGETSLQQGSTVTAPPNNCVNYSLVVDGTANAIARIRGGGTLITNLDVVWAVYKVVLP